MHDDANDLVAAEERPVLLCQHAVALALRAGHVLQDALARALVTVHRCEDPILWIEWLDEALNDAIRCLVADSQLEGHDAVVILRLAGGSSRPNVWNRAPMLVVSCAPKRLLDGLL